MTVTVTETAGWRLLFCVWWSLGSWIWVLVVWWSQNKGPK